MLKRRLEDRRKELGPAAQLARWAVPLVLLFGVLALASLFPSRSSAPFSRKRFILTASEDQRSSQSWSSLGDDPPHSPGQNDDNHDENDDDDEDDCISFDDFNATLEEYCEYLDDRCIFTVVPYMKIVYCYLPLPRWANYIILALFLPIWFFILGRATDKYFCPVLVLITEKLKLSEEVAGVTFLALGNGAADFSATFSAVVGNDFDMAAGELLGAGLFITSIVLAIVAFVSEATVSKIPFLRDASVYLVGVCGLMVVIYFERITIWMAILFFIFYLCYVGVTVAVHYYRLHKEKKKAKMKAAADALTEKTPLIQEDPEQAPIEDLDAQPDSDQGQYDPDPDLIAEEQEKARTEMLEEPSESEEERYWSFEGWKRYWKTKSKAEKGFYVVTYPLRVILNLTTPSVTQWNRLSAVLCPIWSPWLILFAVKEFARTIPTEPFLTVDVPLIAIVTFFGIILAIIIFFTTNWEAPPRFSWAFTAWGFVISTIWIFLAADNVVGVLQSFGFIFDVPSIILGATVLAWGNSLGDVVANVLMAKSGAPRMAITACFAGPAFNLMFGLGASLTYQTIAIFPKTYPVADSHVYYITLGFTLLALVSSLIAVPLITKFKIVRPYAAYLALLYLCYNVLALLASLKILWP